MWQEQVLNFSMDLEQKSKITWGLFLITNYSHVEPQTSSSLMLKACPIVGKDRFVLNKLLVYQ